MASPSSQSLVKRPSDDRQLMPPPPPPKRIKRPPKALDEDDYTDALSHIVARDFFPGLLETRTQQEYLDALESRDREWISSAGRRLTEVMTPGRQGSGREKGRGRRGVSMTPRMTPRGTEAGRGAATPKEWAGDTPMSVSAASASASATPVSTSTPRSKSAVAEVEGMSIGAFQAKYTSEDNESFNKVLDKQNAKKREKYGWMWSGNKIPTARQIAYRKREAKRLEAQKQGSAERDKEEDNDPDNDDGDKQLVVAGGRPGDDERPARPDAWKFKPENSLMFVPASIEDTHETVQEKAEAVSHARPKHVVYHNTRVQPPQKSGNNDSSSSVPPPSPSVSAVRDAIAGHPRPTDSESGFTGGETPRVNGYSFVDEDEPAPTPGGGDDEDDEQAFHLRLLSSQTSSADAGSNPFKLQETRKREALHHRMVERVARNKRTEKAVQGTKTPVPHFGSSPMINFGRTPGSESTPSSGAAEGAGGSKASLTPAAQRLWANVGTPRQSGEGGSGLRNMWTPTPKKTK